MSADLAPSGNNARFQRLAARRAAQAGAHEESARDPRRDRRALARDGERNLRLIKIIPRVTASLIHSGGVFNGE
jgi:hypothetical protein